MNIHPLRPDKSGQKVQTRWSYQHNKDNFVGWVNSLGVEKTWLGKITHFLDEKFKLRRAAYILLFALVISFIVSLDFTGTYPSYEVGALTTEDIRSPLRLEFVDEEQTQHLRKEAEVGVPVVYDFDPSAYTELSRKLHKAFLEMRHTLSTKEKHRDALVYLSEFENLLGGAKISENIFRSLVQSRFRAPIEAAIQKVLEDVRDSRVVADKSSVHPEGTSPNKIIINILERGAGGEGFATSASTLVDIGDLRSVYTSEHPYFKSLSDREAFTAAELVRSLFVPNVTLNKQETEARRQKARESVSSVIVRKNKGELIVREKAPIQAGHVRIMDEIRRLQARQHRDFVTLVTAIFLAVVLLSFLAFVGRFVTRVLITPKDSVAMGSIILTVLILTKFFSYVTSVAFVDRFTSIPASFYQYLMPVAAASMMVGLLIPYGEVVWLFTVFNSVVIGLVTDFNFTYMVTTFVSGIIAARGVYGCKKRDQLYFAGIKTGLVNALMIFCATLVTRQGADGMSREVFWNTMGGFLGGLLSSFVTLTLIPLWESLFSYTTDVRLLELSNLNHPLLKDLIVKAPGTYHHSLVVGSMCEAAAEGIGANPLLAKVTAYYHDIGKMNYAQYFIENQRPGENKHDTINPAMSKTILVAHVKDGVELGRKYKLGRALIDVIEQHHGTTLISFFYQRAKEQENPEMHQTDENEYRYPGPKPQFREAALCMLADSIEAAARSLDEPTPARLQNIVRTIVQRKFLDGQLDECDLTLKDLSTIEEAFSRILLGIYHHRIDYPTVGGGISSKSFKKET